MSNFLFYYINLDEQERRRDSVQNQFMNMKKNNHYMLQRFRALKPENIDLKNHPELLHPVAKKIIESNSRPTHQDHSKNSIGCYFSHLYLWQQVKNEQNIDYLVVFEDDVMFQDYAFDNIVNTVLEFPEKDWDIINIGNRKLWSNPEEYVVHNGYKIFKPNWYTGMSGYVIKLSSINKITKYMIPSRYQFDWQLECFRDKYNIYCVEPFIVNLTSLFQDSKIDHFKPNTDKSFKNKIIGKKNQKFLKDLRQLSLGDIQNHIFGINNENKDAYFVGLISIVSLLEIALVISIFIRSKK